LAQQLLDGGGTLNDATKETFDQTDVLFANLAAVCTQEFLEMIDRDVLIAVAEISMKLTTAVVSSARAWRDMALRIATRHYDLL
jgi:hypothetical protein